MPQYVELYLADELAGHGVGFACGLRRYVVFPGRKWTRLLCPFSLNTAKLPNYLYLKLQPRPAVPSKRLRKIMRANRAAARARGAFDGGKLTDEALRSLWF